MADTFPRQYARTRRLTLGEPRNFVVSRDGQRVVFVRSGAGRRSGELAVGLRRRHAAKRSTSPTPTTCSPGGDLDLPPAGAGAAANGPASRRAASSPSPPTRRPSWPRSRSPAGCSWPVSTGGRARAPGEGAGVRPRPDPTGPPGRVRLRAVRFASRISTARPRHSSRTRRPERLVGFGRVHRGRGDGPDARLLVVARRRPSSRRAGSTPHRTSTAGISADPADPSVGPTELAYPAAGTDNADVMLAVIGLDGEHEVRSAGTARASRTSSRCSGRPDSRSRPSCSHETSARRRCSRQTRPRSPRESSPRTATTRGSRWCPASPDWIGDRLVMAADRDGVRRAPGRRRTDHAGGSAGARDRRGRSRGRLHPGQRRERARPSSTCWRRSRTTARSRTVTDRPGVHTAVSGGPTLVVRSSSLDLGPRTWVSKPGQGGSADPVDGGAATRRAERRAALRRAAQAVGAVAAPPRPRTGRKFPVLLDPYGGPHAPASHEGPQRVPHLAVVRRPGLRRRRDRRPGHAGPRLDWERAVHLDLAGPCSKTRSTRCSSSPPRHPELDLDRVAIRGWSFGGYLAALAVLRRPDVFHAAVAGAPVTEWRLYDTHYTERYLGDPNENADAYDRSPPARRRRRACDGRCCSSMASPTTTSSRPTHCRCPGCCSTPDGGTTCSRCPASPT